MTVWTLLEDISQVVCLSVVGGLLLLLMFLVLLFVLLILLFLLLFLGLVVTAIIHLFWTTAILQAKLDRIRSFCWRLLVSLTIARIDSVLVRSDSKGTFVC